jgi:uncharacterized CHY-type Zn-finger protein
MASPPCPPCPPASPSSSVGSLSFLVSAAPPGEWGLPEAFKKWKFYECVQCDQEPTNVMILKIFSQKWRFLLELQLIFCKKIGRNIGFWEKRQFFPPKLSKIAENCDHSIDPRCKNYDHLVRFLQFSAIKIRVLHLVYFNWPNSINHD